MANYDLSRIYEWPLPVRILLTAFTFIIVLYCTYLFDITPLKQQTRIDADKESVLLKEYKKALSTQTSMQSNMLQLPKLKSLLDSLNQNFVSSNTITETLNNILKIGANNYLKFDLFEPATKIKEGIYTKTPIRIIMTGTYDQMGSFISQIANLDQFIKVGDFTIDTQPTEASTDSSTLAANTPEASQPIPINAAPHLKAELTLEVYEKNL